MLNKEEIKKGLRKELDRTIIANECGLSTNDFSESIKNLEGVLKYIEQLENKVKEQEEYIKDYKRILDIFDNREYRKRYLKERREEEKGLLYPDADEIYKKYYKQEESRQELINYLQKEIEDHSWEKEKDAIAQECKEILNLIEGEKK